MDSIYQILLLCIFIAALYKILRTVLSTMQKKKITGVSSF